MLKLMLMFMLNGKPNRHHVMDHTTTGGMFRCAERKEKGHLSDTLGVRGCWGVKVRGKVERVGIGRER